LDWWLALTLPSPRETWQALLERVFVGAAQGGMAVVAGMAGQTGSNQWGGEMSHVERGVYYD
jgi:hypothetical protein